MKISSTIVHNLISHTCSKTEINLIFYIAQFQLQNGFIPNVFYKDVITQLGINPTTFYRTLYKLSCKGIIQYDISNKYGYYNITLLNNDFSNKDYSEGYININRDLFHTENFIQMKASEKYVFLRLMLRNQDNLNEIKLSDESIAQYAQVSSKNKRLITRIITTLRSFTFREHKVLDVFTDYRSNKTINFFKLLLNSKRALSETEIMQRHMFINFCRKNNISYTNADIKDLIQMDNQYKSYNKLYKNVVHEILLQYKEVKCSIIRSIVDPIVNRLSLATISSEQFSPLV